MLSITENTFWEGVATARQSLKSLDNDEADPRKLMVEGVEETHI